MATKPNYLPNWNNVTPVAPLTKKKNETPVLPAVPVKLGSPVLPSVPVKLATPVTPPVVKKNETPVNPVGPVLNASTNERLPFVAGKSKPAAIPALLSAADLKAHADKQSKLYGKEYLSGEEYRSTEAKLVGQIALTVDKLAKKDPKLAQLQRELQAYFPGQSYTGNAPRRSDNAKRLDAAKAIGRLYDVMRVNGVPEDEISSYLTSTPLSTVNGKALEALSAWRFSSDLTPDQRETFRSLLPGWSGTLEELAETARVL